jgi:hypothetical protein
MYSNEVMRQYILSDLNQEKEQGVNCSFACHVAIEIIQIVSWINNYSVYTADAE